MPVGPWTTSVVPGVSLGYPRGRHGRALFQPLPTVRGVVPQAPALRDLDACELQAGHGRPALAQRQQEAHKKESVHIRSQNYIYIYVTQPK